MKKKKKSLVGWTDKDIWEKFCFKHGNLPCLYLSDDGNLIVEGIAINPLKVRLTLEEI